MTLKEFRELTKDMPEDARIEIPNWHYGENGDKREEVFISEVTYYDFKNQINLW